VSGHQRLAVRRQLPQKTDPDAGRLLGVVFEAVVPVGVLEPDLEHEVPGARTAGSTLWPNIAPGSDSTPSLTTSTSIAPTFSA
jgi:hypothetical protein